MAARVALLFSVTTNPHDMETAVPHSGGWSESHWANDFAPTSAPWIVYLAKKRAVLLPSQCAVIGWRYEQFTILGNQLIPNGCSSGRFLYPGGQLMDLNLPQDALQISAGGVGVPNTTRFSLRCIPDTQIAYGEYQPTQVFKSAMTLYLKQLSGDLWGFVGRVKTGLQARVNSNANNVVTLSADVGGIPGTDFLRFNRVNDWSGNPVVGSFLITAKVGSVYTLSGFPSVTITKPSGTARIDALARFYYSACTPDRATSRKIGRPFAQYRGRASRRAH